MMVAPDLVGNLLETHPAAREAYACPPDRTLIEHASSLTPNQLDAAADRLEHGGAGVPVETPDDPRTLPLGVVDLADANP